MTLCFAFGCNHQSPRESCRFFRFPKDEKLLKKWRDVSRQSDTAPKASSRLCSCHFVDGKKENGPTIFLRNESKKRRALVGGTSSTQCIDGDPIGDRPAQIESAELSNKRLPLDEQPGSCESREAGSSQFSALKRAFHENKMTQLQTENSKLRDELNFLKPELKLKKSKPFSEEPGNVLTYKALQSDQHLFRYYTGLPDPNVFHMLLKWVERTNFTYVYNWSVNKLSLEDQLLLTFVKLRLNSDYIDLAERFQVSRPVVKNVFITLLHVLHSILFRTIRMPSTKKNQHCMPTVFSKFSNCRCIVDCAEIQCALPRSSNSSSSFSHYKNRTTFKGLIACSPHGAVTFLSELYPSSMPKKAIFKESGIVKNFVSGDLIIAGEDFLISDLLPDGVSVYIPPFSKQGQLTEAEANATTEVIRTRIHIERVIGRMQNYHILNVVPANLRKHSSKIFQLIGCLINLHNPLVTDVLPTEDSDTESSGEE